MYDPTIGRWISEDPIGFTAADPNLYRYVGNHPTNVTDPSGLAAVGVQLPPVLDLAPGVPGKVPEDSYVSTGRTIVRTAALAGVVGLTGGAVVFVYEVYHHSGTIATVATDVANRRVKRLVRQELPDHHPQLPSGRFVVQEAGQEPRDLLDSAGMRINLDDSAADIVRRLESPPNNFRVEGPPRFVATISYAVQPIQRGQRNRSGDVNYNLEAWARISFRPRPGAALVTQSFYLGLIFGSYHDNTLETRGFRGD